MRKYRPSVFFALSCWMLSCVSCDFSSLIPPNATPPSQPPTRILAVSELPGR